MSEDRHADRPAKAILRDPQRRAWLVFDGPREVLAAHRLDEVHQVLGAVDDALRRGQHAAGFLSYESAPALDPTLDAHPPGDGAPPLAWFLCGPPPRVAADLADAGFDLPGLDPAGADLSGTDPSASDRVAELPWRPLLDRDEHARAVEHIRALIAAGNTYQVNFTFPLETPFTGDPRRLFRHLWRAQAAPYSSYIDAGRWALCSASPELFFRQDGPHLLARPMKGTSRRGRFPAEDDIRRSELHSTKNRAENLMITDMTRNDLGRLAEPGSVVVEKLFAEETFTTVHQLISEVSARTDAAPLDVLRTLFPCASITGAPKKRTTEIIRQLEKGPRGVYTGAVGWIAPDRRAEFSVAIRTAVVDRAAGRARYGVGGGIVWDSEPALEYDECRAKALVLATSPARGFELLETLQWRPRRGFVRLTGHLDRLGASAAYFEFPFDRPSTVAALEARAEAWPRERHRVRLRLDDTGELHVDAGPWPCAGRKVWRLAVDDRPVDERQPLLFHKTTDRRLYDGARARHPGADEVILWNRHGRLTEGTRSNLVLRLDDEWLTPPLGDGVLPGVYRQLLLERGRIREQPLDLGALERADAIFAINSLRGWIRCALIAASSDSAASTDLADEPQTADSA
ncbi:MAG: chorismate-binding protein, partial [Acidobacteriota bacterium]